MRSFWRTASPGLLRDVGLVCLADAIVGVSFGATSLGGGLPWWVPVALSLLVFAGGSQIAAVGVVLAGGSPLAAVLAGAVLNTRLFPYGFAVADVLGPAGSSGAVRRWLARLAGTHVITDESVAFTLRQSDPARRRSAFWACGLALFAIWNLSVLLGVGLGTAVRDTGAFGLDATFPAVMLALALPTLASRPARVAAGAGAVIAVALTPVLPAGLPLLAALAGLGTRWGVGRERAGRWRRLGPSGGGAKDATTYAGGEGTGSANASTANLRATGGGTAGAGSADARAASDAAVGTGATGDDTESKGALGTDRAGSDAMGDGAGKDGVTAGGGQ